MFKQEKKLVLLREQVLKGEMKKTLIEDSEDNCEKFGELIESQQKLINVLKENIKTKEQIIKEKERIIEITNTYLK